jgi:hypothetical protein
VDLNLLRAVVAPAAVDDPGLLPLHGGTGGPVLACQLAETPPPFPENRQ